MTMKKILAFDLDGTLTQHKTPLVAENRAVLEQLARRYRLLMLGAGVCERIYHQMGDFPIEIIGNYGLQHSVVENGRFRLVEEAVCPVDRALAIRAVDKLRRQFGLDHFYGDSVEFHSSGSVTFPILGTAAPLAEKLAYDPDRHKRRMMYPAVCAEFAGCNVFIGGSSSFDITQGEYNKFHALRRFCEQNGYSLSEALYVGDDFGPGGNDSAVKLAGVDCIEIDDYRTFPSKVAFLLL